MRRGDRYESFFIIYFSASSGDVFPPFSPLLRVCGGGTGGYNRINTTSTHPIGGQDHRLCWVRPLCPLEADFCLLACLSGFLLRLYFSEVVVINPIACPSSRRLAVAVSKLVSYFRMMPDETHAWRNAILKAKVRCIIGTSFVYCMVDCNALTALGLPIRSPVPPLINLPAPSAPTYVPPPPSFF